MRPLLILDCDEVILEFARPFQRWLLEERQIRLTFESFRLTSNMRHVADGELVDRSEFPALLNGFFAEGQWLQHPAEGAVEILSALAERVDIMVLTNIPEIYRRIRADVLRFNGLSFPVYSNAGPKGPMVAQLAEGRRALFVDDLPPHHESAATHAPEVTRLHMVADHVLRPLIGPAPAAHARIDDWKLARPWIEARLLEKEG